MLGDLISDWDAPTGTFTVLDFKVDTYAVTSAIKLLKAGALGARRYFPDAEGRCVKRASIAGTNFGFSRLWA
jgi:hypothetical protein